MFKLITQTLGSIPQDMIDSSCKKELYFNNNYTLKGTYEFTDKSIWNSLYSNLNTSVEIKKNIIDILLKMLIHNPLDRITANQALLHPLFNNI